MWLPVDYNVPELGKASPTSTTSTTCFEFPPNLSDFLTNFDLWILKLEIPGKISTAYSVNKEGQINSKPIPCKYHEVPVKRKKREEIWWN